MSHFRNIALPAPFKCLVRSEFLHDGDPEHVGRYERCIAHRVVVEPGHCLRFMIVTERGALFHGMPIHALCMRECDPAALEFLCMWNCMAHHAAVYRDPWRSGLGVQVKMGNGVVLTGQAMFSVDYVHADPQLCDGGWSSQPDEVKEHNVIAMDGGHIAAMPGNRIVWLDSSFVDDSARIDFASQQPISYRTNTRVWSCEGKRSSQAGEWR